MLAARYISPYWWREALGARVRTAVRSIGFKPYIFDKSIEGVACRVKIANPTAAAWYGQNAVHASQELRFVRDHLLRPGMTVVEVGAHHGHETIPLSRWVGPTGRVIAVEPLPENLEIMAENKALNGLDNVEIAAAALGAVSGQARIRNTSNASISTGGGGLEVEALTLDALCAARNARPDLLKLDVEGFEVDVLMGARETLAHGPALQIELHVHALPKFSRTVEDFWRLIEVDRYELWLQTDDLRPPEPIPGPVHPGHRAHIFAQPKPVN